MLTPVFYSRRMPVSTLFADAFGAMQREGTARAIPFEVTAKGQDYLVTADLPGYRKEDIAVEIDATRVTIRAEVRDEKPADGEVRVLYSERATGRAERSFELAHEIDETRASARYVDGVLTLVLPKKVAETRKLLAIQ
ncbi:MAG: Hsp20/alpha crystallin family protein [Burkholderiales bacterium]|nr:Hsp20/alpha crystallin family protein [Burkholderiales bacterium]